MVKKNLVEIAKKRREWVNKNYGNMARNTHMSNTEKKKLMTKLWKQAKKDIK